jgi:outer membrane receptor protein involved in Fe transport
VHNNIAGYVQASYRPRKTWKLVAGGRLDHNEIDGQEGEEGFGTLFSPRLAVVYTPGSGRSVYKAIYAEAFKDPSDQEKYTLQPFTNDIPAGALRPEKVRNFELGGDWRPAPGLSLGVAAYQASYRELVGLRLATFCQGGFCFTGTQPHNVGEATIRGAQAQFQYHRPRGELFGNYTYTDPRQTQPLDLRIGDIASHRLNVGIDVFWRPDLASDLRVNYVGARKTGAGTTVSTNPLSQVDAYTVTSTTLTYRLPFRGNLGGSKLQLIVDNLFDATVYHPGVRGAGLGFAAQIPQPGRRIYLQFLTVAPGRGA